jgi:protein-glutamine gamma-glutamyltransferase
MSTPRLGLPAQAAMWRQRLVPASRETRDTLFMLAVIAWTLLPHLLRLAPWVGLICGAVLLWRALLAWRQAPLPGRWSLVAILLLAAGLTFWTERTLLGKDAGVTLLVMLMALKTLELRARRDALVVFFLGFFLVLTQFLYSQSLWTGLATAVAVWGWLTALTLAHMPAGRPRLAEAGGLAARAALFGTPVMLALFMLFPRFGPLWNMAGDSARTGLSDELRLGDVGDLANDDSIAFRVRFQGEPPPRSQLYFRGPVLSDYNGEQWRAGWAGLRRPPPPSQPDTTVNGPGLPYEMTLEAMRVPWLPLLEFTPLPPEAATPLEGLRPSADDSGQWRLRAPLAERIRLSARAWPQAERGTTLGVLSQRNLVDLPPGQHPRTHAWAAAFRNRPGWNEADATTLARAVMAHIRTAGFTYTLAPGAYEGDAVDEFWLDRRRGFCEHFAVAFVVVMRAMDVPARIVTGYQGADALPQDGWLVVRQANAHAWAEYWQPGQGWLRADPTAAVAPDRIERGRPLPAPPGLVAGVFDAVNPGLRLELRRWVETLENRWNQSVLGYGRSRQFELLGQLGFERPDGVMLARLLVGLVAAVGLAGALWAWWDARRRTPWQRVQAHIRRELGTLGVAAEDFEDPGALARRVQQAHGEPAHGVVQALQALQAQRYGPRGSGRVARSWARGFSREVAALRAARRGASLQPAARPG